ncbi:hypothetical protein ABZX39_39630, partial [Streptomyces collinus]|uniref:hypothetical protein n=1 Tax=Streptomyces collinus TaxID=42684 RepID=UPI0033A927F6
MNRFGDFGEGGFGTVVDELVIALAEVVGGGVGAEGLEEVETDAEAAGAHRGFQRGFAHRRGLRGLTHVRSGWGEPCLRRFLLPVGGPA